MLLRTEMILLEDDSTWPAPDSKWRHKNGIVYIVQGYANLCSKDEAKHPTSILYYNANNFALYVRPIMDWDRSMSPMI